MSNIKISNLPLIPSVSPDDVLPIVDSGFTTTYKVKVSSLQGTSGTSGVSGSSGTSGTSGLGFTWQGGWQSITTYFINDVVYYSGASYVALGTIAAGGNPPDVNASWENMNAQGQAGTNGTSGTSGVSGSSGTSGTSGTDGTSGTSGTSGMSNSVYSGGTLVVSGATILNFSGATITSGGTGQANITITAEGGLVNGTGTSSLKQKDGLTTTPATASATNSIAIGNAASAGGNNSVSIGTNTGGWTLGTDSIAIGKHPGLGSSNNIIAIGSGAYNNTPFGIAIGHETSAQQNGICIGSNTTRATGSHSVSLGNAIENNIGTYSVVIGYNNRAGIAPNFNGNPYGVLIGSGHRADTNGFYNSVLGGVNNTISGATSNSFIGNGVGLTSVRTGDIIINSSGNTITGTGEYKISIGGFGNTISGSGTFGTIINGNSNSITGGINNAIIGGQSNTNSSTRGFIAGGINNTATGTNNFVAGESNNASGWNAYIIGYNNQNSAEIGFIGGGNSCNLQGQTNGIIGAEQTTILGSTTNTKQNFIGGGFGNNITTSLRASVIGGLTNAITSSPDSAIIGGTGNTITSKANAVMIGCINRTAIAPDSTHLEALILMNPLTEYSNNAAAKAGGLLDGQLYRNNSGAVHIVFT
jgi:hypothetical protein